MINKLSQGQQKCSMAMEDTLCFFIINKTNIFLNRLLSSFESISVSSWSIIFLNDHKLPIFFVRLFKKFIFFSEFIMPKITSFSSILSRTTQIVNVDNKDLVILIILYNRYL